MSSSHLGDHVGFSGLAGVPPMLAGLPPPMPAMPLKKRGDKWASGAGDGQLLLGADTLGPLGSAKSLGVGGGGGGGGGGDGGGGEGGGEGSGGDGGGEGGGDEGGGSDRRVRRWDSRGALSNRGNEEVMRR